MQACGYGLVAFTVETVPAMAQFIEGARAEISCEDIAKASPAAGDVSGDDIVRQSWYLTHLTSWFWSVAGISWRALILPLALAFGISITLVYGIFRLAMSPAIATAGALAMATSLLQLSSVLPIRDFAKAPFVLGAVLILGLLVRRALSVPKTLGLAALYGIVVGLGLGMRADVLLCVPPFVVAVLLFLPGHLVKTLRLRVATLAVFFVVFMIAWSPVRSGYSGGSATPHWIYLGMQSSWNELLGVSSPTYDIGHFYADSWGIITSWSQATRRDGISDWSEIGWSSLAARRLLEAVVRTFPADVIVRAYAATFAVLDLPFTPIATGPEPGPGSSLAPNLLQLGITEYGWARFYEWRAAAQHALVGTGPLWALAAILIVSARSPRLGVFLALFVAYFAGVNAIQFHPRHYFFWEFMGLWALGFVVQSAWTAGRRLFARWRSGSLDWRRRPGRTALLPVGRAVLAVGGVAAVGVAILAGARSYQQERVGQMFSYLAHAERLPVATTLTDSDKTTGWALAQLDGPLNPGGTVNWTQGGAPGNMQMTTSYVLAEFDELRCTAPTIRLTVRYEGINPNYPPLFGWTYEYSPYPTTERALGLIGVPIYEIDWPAGGISQRFIGVDMPREQAACFRGLYRVQDIGTLPVLVAARLPSGWESLPHYQVFTDWEQGNPLEKWLETRAEPPRYVVNQQTNDWTLLGYTVDERALASGAPTVVILEWLAPAGLEPTPFEAFIHRGGRRWAQAIEAVNSIGDGTFQSQEPSAVLPVSIYSGDEHLRQSRLERIEGQASRVAVLGNEPGQAAASYATAQFPVEPRGLYLQSGWVKGEGAHAYLGRVWLPSNRFSYAAMQADPPEWKRYEQLLVAPDDAIHAQVWLLNLQGTGPAYFHNVIFAKLGMPNPAVCRATMPKGARCGPPLLGSHRP
jgi:hypothetical protein